MVDLTDAGAPAAKSASKEKAPIEEPKPVQKPAEVSTPTPSDVKPEVSVAKSKPRPKKKTALKYKTFKTREVLKKALQDIESKVEKAPPKPLEDTIKRLKEKVAQTEKHATGISDGKTTEKKGSKSGAYAHGSKQEIELIDIYRSDIAYQVNANWAFSEHLADRGQKLMASLVFKVMPDGSIHDIFFVDRSGNQYLDESAMKAVMKSSPVKPHPKELQREYVELGLRFTPEGVR
jgi:colicin import membrane protein